MKRMGVPLFGGRLTIAVRELPAYSVLFLFAKQLALRRQTRAARTVPIPTA